MNGHDLVGVTGWSCSSARRVQTPDSGPEGEAEAPAADLRIRHADAPDQGLAAGRHAVGQVPRGDHGTVAAEAGGLR
jgi:hypothetical protein